MERLDLVQLIECAVFQKRLDSFDVLHFANLDAALSSARYYQSQMLKARNFPNDLEHLTFVLTQISESGLCLEFGVASGRTLSHIASQLQNRTVYGFDSFAGLPETWRTNFEVRKFAQIGRPNVPSNCTLISGMFEETLPDFFHLRTENVAFIHIDCDLYSATKTVLEACGPGLREGSVLCFDEYFNYPGYLEHEFRAWKEFCERSSVEYEYLGFVSSHQQVSVRVTQLANGSGIKQERKLAVVP